MTSAFILNLNVGSDTDLLTIASEISDAVTNDGMEVVSCVPWKHPTLDQSAARPPTPTDVSVQQTQ